MLLLLFAALPLGAALADTRDNQAGVINLLFIGHSQREGSGYHLSHVYAPVFNQSLGSEKIRLEYHEDLKLLTKEGLADFDAVMLYGNYADLTPEQEASLLAFVENGGAFLPVHSASACFGHSDAFVKLVGGRFHSHGWETFTTRIAPGQEKHPILQGYKGFETQDETYVHADHNEQNRTVLMLREDEPWTWVRQQGKGRVFYTAYGHDHHTWNQLAFHDLLIRGILWAVGDEKRAANRALVASLPKAKYEDRGTIPNYRRVEPPPQYQFPMNVKDSMALTQVEKNFELQFFVGEPDIVNPVAFTWDERGRLFIVESIDYPNELRQDGKGNDRITLCEDTDGDGRADKCTPFAEGLNIPTGIVAYDGGFIVSQAPHFLFLKDTDGDDKADVRILLNSVWGTEDTHAGPSNLRYGHDNHIWGAVGYSSVETDTQGKFQNGVYRMKPDGTRIEPIGQFNNNTWGLGISEDFEIFGSTANNAPAFHVPLWRNHVFGKHEDLMPGMAARLENFSQVFPITPNFLQVDAHGRYTAGSGFNLYTARSFPQQFWNASAFIGEPTAHLLGQFFLEPKGSSYVAKNRGSMISSSDEWVSPVFTDVGPDGQLWVADWYNFIIQHNPMPTKESAGFDAELGAGNAHVNPLRDGKHGRIYRLVYKGADKYKPLDLSQADAAALVKTLSNDNLFWRITAQRKLVQEKRVDAIPALRAILLGQPKVDALGLDVAAIHAIWSLQGLGAFSMDNKSDQASIRRALIHSSAAVRKNAVQALIESGRLADLKTAGALIEDQDDKVRLQALVAVSKQPPSKEAAQSLLRLRAQLPTDPWLTQALVLASLSHVDYYWAGLTSDKPRMAKNLLQGFDSPEEAPEYLITKRQLINAPKDLSRILADWKSIKGGQLPMMVMAAIQTWRDRFQEPNPNELKHLQALINQMDSEGQMAVKLRASGLALNFDKVEDELYEKYHAQHAFSAHVWSWGLPESGEVLFKQHCTGCHSDDASGNKALGAPPLAGMENWYVQTQLQKFFAGLRGIHFKDPNGMSMRASLEFLQLEMDPNRDMSHLGYYLVTLPRGKQEVTVEGSAERGAALYAPCAACHGADGLGNQTLKAPGLAGQADWYLLRQLENFRSGARGADPRDTEGQQMASFAKMIADDQALKDLVAYIRELGEKAAD